MQMFTRKKSWLAQFEYSMINSLNERTFNSWVRKSKDAESDQLVLVSKRQTYSFNNISRIYGSKDQSRRGWLTAEPGEDVICGKSLQLSLGNKTTP